ncbi:MAG: aminotransferase class III-fold pyridoxal phosphate-dependent enzyme [Clostridia bacterium]|nr:aminotransferase class III-fold pyridoxal phosphate-dependent enzyme [Clostridia bacterium]
MNNNSHIYEILEKYVAGGSSTGSKRATLFPEDPAANARGMGCRLWDADGNEYIDYRNSLGPVTLGYCYPEVNDAVKKQLDMGIVYGHPGILEAMAAEKLCSIIPCAEKVRFLKTGGEAVAACIKLARAYTGREHIIQIGYNGWLNVLSSGARANPRDTVKGIPLGISRGLSELHHTVAWNDTDMIDTLFESYEGQIAAVVIAADYENMEQGREFYPYLRDITRKNDALLIFDEIVTGFRIALAGVQEFFGVTPDLAIFAKGMANGMPLSVFCGRTDVMDMVSKGASISSTYGGEQLSLAAALAVIDIYQRENVVDYLKENGNKLWTEINSILYKKGIPIEYKGMGQCPVMVGKDLALRERFMRRAYVNGVSLYSVSYINFSHKAGDITETIEKLNKAASEI